MPFNDERESRILKLQKLLAEGIDPFPSRANRTHACLEVLNDFDGLSKKKIFVTVTGRIRSIRRHGGSAFFFIQDQSAKIQIFFQKNVLGASYHLVSDIFDMGDFIEATGTVCTTKTGEKTIVATDVRIIAKALLPLPEQWHGLSEVEMRYRQRYLDTLANEAVKDVFIARSRVVACIREYFEAHGFLEVETPVLQPLAGGATARPFVTHHHALDQDMYLRIAPELYLKRLVVGGFERVYEFARCFRNEGIDHAHNPEFTMLEAYMAYADYTVLMEFIEGLFLRLLQVVPRLAFQASFPRIQFFEALKEKTGLSDSDVRTADTILSAAKKYSLRLDRMSKTKTKAHLLDILFKEYVVRDIAEPTFIIDHPRELSPLSKKKPEDNRCVERFQLIMHGQEIVNAFSEINDPLDQRERFEEQERSRAAGDDEAHHIDEDYITALEHGMPPTAGLGLGVDRLVALLTGNHNVKEVIFFPTLRNKRDT